MTITRFPLALLLSLALAACGGAPDPLPAPAPDGGPGLAPQPPSPCAPAPQPLQVDKIDYTGGVYNGSTFEARRTAADCMDATIPPRPSSCASWTLSLPPAPAGYDREITIASPLRAVSGGPAAFEGGCTEELEAALWMSDNVFDYKRDLHTEPLILNWPATQITVSACARGAAVLQVAPPIGLLRFVVK